MKRIKVVGLIFIVAVIVLIAVQFGLIKSNMSYTKNVQDLHKNSQKITQIYSAFGLLLDIETSSRGFLLTGDKAFLEPHDVAQEKLPIEIEKLREYLTHEEFTNISSLMETRVAYADILIEKYKRGEKITRQDLDVGKKQMDSIRHEISVLIPRETKIQKEQVGVLKSSSEGLNVIMIGGAIFSILIVIGSSFFVYFEFKERLKMQKALSLSLATSEAITNNIGQGVVVADKSGKVVYANEITLDIRKMTLEEIQRHMLEDLFDKTIIEKDHLKALLSTDKTVVETMASTSTGQIRTVKVTFSPLLIKNAVEGVVVAFVDISKEADSISELTTGKEDALNASKAKSDFLAKMSHEIRTPLNAILGVGEILNLTKLNDEQRKCMEIYQRSSLTLINLVNDILDLSKIEAGKIELNPIPFSLKNLMDTCASIMDFRASQKGLLFKSRLMSNYDHLIGDEGRIRQIVINLLGNAIKFTEKGSITLTVTCIDRGTDDKELLISVKDTGRGIAQENIGKLFNNYEQEHGKIASEYGGTGLGLSLSRELAHLMGGDITIKSEVGKGSEFILSCFVQGGHGDFENEATPKGQVDKNLKILLVDDNPENRFIVRRFLDESEVTISEVGDGDEAVEIFKKEKFDMIFMDINMPKKDGLTATKEIRDLEKQKKLPHTLIIALSANALSQEYDRAMEVGCDDYLTKPLARVRLLNTIEKWQSSIVRKDTMAVEAEVEIEIDEAIKAVIPQYMENRRKDLDTLKSALEIKELKVIKKISHNIAGTAENYGQVQLGDTAALLDQASSDGNWEEIEKLILKIEKILKA